MQKAAGESGESIIVTAGWSEAHGRAIGAVYHSLSGFASQLLTEPGHTTMPEVNPGGTDYLDLAARWSPAAMGEETEAFHVALAKNFYESYEWGRLRPGVGIGGQRSEEHTSELQSLMRISYAVFCLKKKKKTIQHN